jgi:alkylhydroperoxidase family enzyme
MIHRLILARLDAAEKQLGASLDYARHIARVSLRAFFKFVKIMPLASYRRTLPRGPYHVARIVATRDEDCGTCVQIVVNAAKKSGVPATVLRAVLDRRPDELPEELAEAYHFAEEVVTATWQEGVWRERIRRRYGDEALVELALAIAACRVFPITKRALGFATSCRQVNIQV